MARTLEVRIVPDALLAQADRIEALVEQQTARLAAIDAVNEVVVRAEASTREGEIADINLSDAYVRSKTDLALASRTPRAEVTVRGDLTILGRFPLVQLAQSASSKAKGDPSRGIPAGSKQAGLQVSIKRSTSKPEPKWFTMRLRRGQRAGENVGVFVRTGPGRGDVKHIYGPSPYSLFRYQAGLQLDDIADDLQRTTDAAIDERMQRKL
jgi:hypothetical protein